MVAPGGVHGCSRGGIHGCWGEVCDCSRGHAWLLRGAWLLGGACMVALGGLCGCSQGGHVWLLLGGHAWDMTRYRDMVNERVVCILLECVLVSLQFATSFPDIHVYIQWPMHINRNYTAKFLLTLQ